MYIFFEEAEIKFVCCFKGIELTGKKKEEVWNGEDESDPDIISTLHIQRVREKGKGTAALSVCCRSF